MAAEILARAFKNGDDMNQDLNSGGGIYMNPKKPQSGWITFLKVFLISIVVTPLLAFGLLVGWCSL